MPNSPKVTGDHPVAFEWACSAAFVTSEGKTPDETTIGNVKVANPPRSQAVSFCPVPRQT
ncbi:hypothetical protein E5D57_007628 [Metarhizium anisopliae]|nr:hypothetical protein E5D57_007628 [Metarhizium anisopliae]